MGQNKLQRFSELKEFPNALEYPSGMKSNWKNVFENTHPITLELACGKGEYTIGLARLYPQRNCIGVDIKGNRMWVGARTALKEHLNNAFFLRSQIERIEDYFAPGEVAEIWITFPDPQLRAGKAKKRLTHPRFVKMYQHILQPNGRVHLKTDSPDLYHFTKQVIQHFGFTLLADIADLSIHPRPSEELLIKTHYEKLDIAQSNRIHYLQFLPDQPITPEMEEAFKQLIQLEYAV